MKPELGKKYWCIQPSIESISYDYDGPPHEPWLGVLVNEHKLSLVTDLFECGYDEDTNATAFVTPSDLFETKEEAGQAYIEEMAGYIMYVKARVKDLEGQLDRFRLGY